MLFQQRFHGSAICRVLGGMPLASPQQREQFVDLAPLRLTKRARPLWTIMLGFGISLSGQRRGGNASDQRQITLTRSDRTCLIRLAVRQWVRLTDMHGGPYTPQLLLNFPSFKTGNPASMKSLVEKAVHEKMLGRNQNTQFNGQYVESGEAGFLLFWSIQKSW